MRPTDFTAPAGHLVPVTDGPAGCFAFVPALIPRTLVLGNRTIGLLSHADNALGRLQGSASRLVNPYLIARPLLRREAILSSRMEGTRTTAAKLVSHEAQQVEAPDAQTQEVANYITAMNHGLSLLDQLPLCLRLIRELHAKLLEGVRGAEETPGEFRLIQNFIGHDLRSARFVPPPASHLEHLLRDLEQFLNEEETPESPPLLVRMALTHYQFETIHPFRDGNGRVGRLLIPLTLQAHARLSSPALYLSGFFEQHRRQYVDLMLAASQRSEFESWIQFFLQAVQSAAQESVERVEHLLQLRQRYHSLLQTVRSPALTLKLVDKLFELPLLTVASAAEELDVTAATATQHVQRLVDAKILVEVTGRKRDRQYLAPELLQALGTEQE
jgi:Fic family protein